MDELQTEEAGIEPNESEVTAPVESGAELATAHGEDQTKNHDGAQKAINKQHAKFRDEERKRIASDDRAADFERQLNEIKAKDDTVVIPPVPDPYAEDYAEQVTARDAAIRRSAEVEAGKTAEANQQSANKEASQRAESDRIGVLVEGYDKRAVTLGLSVDDVKQAGQTVIDNGLPGELAEFLLSDEDGPLITKHLAANPIAVDELRNMPVTSAVLKIHTSIREAASALKPQASGAPDPIEVLSGRGAGEKEHPLLKGATFT